MIELFFILVGITHILCMAIQIVIQPGMLLEKLGDWGSEQLKKGHKWVEPVFLCPYCAPSCWTFVAYIFAILLGFISKFEWEIIALYPIIVGATSLLNGIVWSIHELIRAKKKYYENAEKLKYLEIKERKNKFQNEKANHRQQNY